MNWYLFAKAFHIIGFVSWFSGLFYLVRLFIYHAEANEKKTPEEAAILKPQYALMQRRLYSIITNPAMIITWIGGLTMIFINPAILSLWLYVKLGLVFLLTGYHHYCKSLMKKLANDANKITSEQLRGVNEIPTLFLFAIVLLAVFKNFLHFGVALAGLVGLSVLLFIGIKIYKRNREKAGN